ncbi:F-box domain-containing protein [Mycena venus]|uniref:F-box domain-containing protein n=1 Tax=Mycena venus TaxID=2733690 RepID=A0A8H7CY31_9AGAR|nr:F-box domain-containing protein [Mycena venus]
MFAQLRKRLTDLDAQITEQRRVLAELEQTRSDVERELHAIAYPVLTLPFEITAEIFLRCRQLWGFAELYHRRTIDQNTTPIKLASVCRAWRDIILATPLLWSEVWVYFDALPAELVSKPAVVEGDIDRWLIRAGGRPLTLYFECGKGEEAEDEEQDEPFALGRLRDIIHRWSPQVQYLHLVIDRDIGPLGLESLQFPLLESVALDCNYEARVVDPHRRVFTNAPRFHDLRMGLPLAFTFPWSQLTKFQGELWDVVLFTLAPNLCEVTCSFRPDDSDHLVVTHRNLRSLTSHVTDILEYLTLPALQHLAVLYLSNHHSIVDFISRSSPPLISLSVPGDHAGTSFNSWGQCVPRTLESLEICEVSAAGLVDPSILDVLPNLRTLILKDVAGGFDFYFLVGYLYSRSNQLRTFKLVWQNNPFLDGKLYDGLPGEESYDTISGHLSRLAQSGMNIRLGTRDKRYFPIRDTAIV